MINIMDNHHKISVIIPVSEDWNTIEKCLMACDKFIPTSSEIIIVNDVQSPEIVDKKITDFIKKKSRFKYHKTDVVLNYYEKVNLATSKLSIKDNDILLLSSSTEPTSGFIDELQSGLYAFEKNAICCPRSNEADIFSFPIDHQKITKEESYAYWDEAKNHLPRFKVVPTVNKFCMLIKRSVINNLGLFENTSLIQFHKEEDFCCRINQYGYSTIMANYSFVYYHKTRALMTEKTSDLNIKSFRELIARYPHYKESIENYYLWQVEPGDNFATATHNFHTQRKRILYDLTRLPAIHNGTSECAIALIKELYPILSQKYELYIYVNETADRYFNISKQFQNVTINSNYSPLGHFDLVYTPFQIFELEHVYMLNRIATKIVVNLLDIISVRCLHLRNQEYDVINKYLTDFADGIIFISKGTIDDLDSCYNIFTSPSYQIRTPIYLAKTNEENHLPLCAEEQRIIDNIPSNFILIFGNQHKHKSIDLAVSNLEPNEEIVVFGGNNTQSADHPNCHYLESGNFSDRFIHELHRKSRIILFPSQYEGYGLPIISAIIHNKPIIIFKTNISIEVTESLGIRNNVHFFDKFSDLSRLVNQVDLNPVYQPNLKTWKDVAKETANVLEKILSSHLNTEILFNRFNKIRELEFIQNHTLKNNIVFKKLNLTLESTVEENKRLSKNLYQIHHSLSWRLTAPLRALRRLFRK